MLGRLCSIFFASRLIALPSGATQGRSVAIARWIMACGEESALTPTFFVCRAPVLARGSRSNQATNRRGPRASLAGAAKAHPGNAGRADTSPAGASGLVRQAYSSFRWRQRSRYFAATGSSE